MKPEEKHNRLTAVRFLHRKKGNRYWVFRCDCGQEVIAPDSAVAAGTTKSCGCYHREESAARARRQFTKHGLGGTRLYCIWKSMKTRCYNSNSKSYKDYGGRGISICEEWCENFLSFHNWAMGNGYSEKLTIDRIDNDREYSPTNCRWVSTSAQALNKRNTARYKLDGRLWTAKEISEAYGIKESTFRDRLYSGWSVERAAREPVKQAI